MSMETVRDSVAKFIVRRGLVVHRAGRYPVGRSPLRDAEYILGDVTDPCVFDVGANRGQTLEAILKRWPAARAHCFEPTPSLLPEVNRRADGNPNVKVNACAVGSAAGELEFHEYGDPLLNSFLEPGKDLWEGAVNSIKVQTVTLDEYCERNGVEKIDLLKIDTQGFDLEALKGADGLLNDGKVAMILVEVNFWRFYENQVSPGALIDYLISKDYLPVCFYEMNYKRGQGSWCDALFLHRSRSIPAA